VTEFIYTVILSCHLIVMRIVFDNDDEQLCCLASALLSLITSW